MHRAISRRMGVNRFEDLRVWQAAKRQCDRVGELIRRLNVAKTSKCLIK
jgi:hypothetical protein